MRRIKVKKKESCGAEKSKGGEEDLGRNLSSLLASKAVVSKGGTARSNTKDTTIDTVLTMSMPSLLVRPLT